MQDHKAHLLVLADRQGIIKTSDVASVGIPTVYLSRLVRSGELERVARGLYARPGTNYGEHTTLLEVAKQVPKGVICLVSALRYYDIGTQRPARVWIAIPAHAKGPRSSTVELEVVRMEEEALRAGVRLEVIGQGEAKVFEPSKTVADLFKFRNRVGMDIVLEALKEYWRSPYRDVASLRRYSQMNRVENVMRPYLESVAG